LGNASCHSVQEILTSGLPKKISIKTAVHRFYSTKWEYECNYDIGRVCKGVSRGLFLGTAPVFACRDREYPQEPLLLYGSKTTFFTMNKRG
jgi:hypothetical protein